MRFFERFFHFLFMEITSLQQFNFPWQKWAIGCINQITIAQQVKIPTSTILKVIFNLCSVIFSKSITLLSCFLILYIKKSPNEIKKPMAIWFPNFNAILTKLLRGNKVCCTYRSFWRLFACLYLNWIYDSSSLLGRPLGNERQVRETCVIHGVLQIHWQRETKCCEHETIILWTYNMGFPYVSKWFCHRFQVWNSIFTKNGHNMVQNIVSEKRVRMLRKFSDIMFISNSYQIIPIIPKEWKSEWNSHLICIVIDSSQNQQFPNDPNLWA